MITVSNYTGPSFLAINGWKKLRTGRFRTLGVVKGNRRLLMKCDKSSRMRRNAPEPELITFRVFLEVFLPCTLGTIHYPYPLASRGHLHTDEEDKSLDSELQVGTWRYRQLPRGHTIQKFLEHFHTSILLSIVLCLCCGIFLTAASREVENLGLRVELE